MAGEERVGVWVGQARVECDVLYTQCFWKSHGESLKFSHVIETLHMHLKSNQVWGCTCSVQFVRSDPCQLPVIMATSFSTFLWPIYSTCHWQFLHTYDFVPLLTLSLIHTVLPVEFGWAACNNETTTDSTGCNLPLSTLQRTGSNLSKVWEDVHVCGFMIGQLLIGDMDKVNQLTASLASFIPRPATVLLLISYSAKMEGVWIPSWLGGFKGSTCSACPSFKCSEWKTYWSNKVFTKCVVFPPSVHYVQCK